MPCGAETPKQAPPPGGSESAAPWAPPPGGSESAAPWAPPPGGSESAAPWAPPPGGSESAAPWAPPPGGSESAAPWAPPPGGSESAAPWAPPPGGSESAAPWGAPRPRFIPAPKTRIVPAPRAQEGIGKGGLGKDKEDRRQAMFPYSVSTFRARDLLALLPSVSGRKWQFLWQSVPLRRLDHSSQGDEVDGKRITFRLVSEHETSRKPHSHRALYFFDSELRKKSRGQRAGSGTGGNKPGGCNDESRTGENACPNHLFHLSPFSGARSPSKVCLERNPANYGLLHRQGRRRLHSEG